ncbi:MAG: SDR family oxidoreductase, partial [Flammeovirgaceae bacterium]|nr:SDR family oxidoreductase [Flammeovirgaceae bacterium]MDW8288295.1 SDR family oxidoreductase [Flammeovirgaceae bacterium]
GGPAPKDAIDAMPKEFYEAFTMHLVCNQHLVQTFVPLMKKNGYGRIINVISTSVKVPIAGLGVSNTIRGAVASWAKTLARELAPYGITVNNVLPGLTKTARLEALTRSRAEKAGISFEEQEKLMRESVPVRRFAAPEEIAFAIAFLASPAASYINGINLPVDGGSTPCL